MSVKFQKHELLLLLCVCIYYFVVAYKSSGFHQEDEHYQIVEFANYKLGLISDKTLAWEFRDQIRPGLQPMICYGLFTVLTHLGVTSNFDLMFILRGITALFSICIITNFYLATKHMMKQEWHPYYMACTFLLWFLPFINVRFSSETWSGIFFLIAMTAILKVPTRGKNLSYTYIGIVLGISILFRYQSALLVAGIFLWLAIIKKSHMTDLFVFLTTLTSVLAFGILIDRWFYGNYIFTLYRYFYVNLVNDVASSFGVSPWYEYVLLILKSPGPLGILIVLSFVTLSIARPKSSLIWSIVPFLVIHSIIPHKELRFLFPIANIIPLFLFLSYQILSNVIVIGTKWIKLPMIISLIAIFFCNLAGLIGVASTSAGKGQVNVLEFINRTYDIKSLNVILIDNAYPFHDSDVLGNSFYNSENLTKVNTPTIFDSDALEDLKHSSKKNIVIAFTKNLRGSDLDGYLKKVGLVPVFKSIPSLTKLIYDIYQPRFNDNCIVVFELK